MKLFLMTTTSLWPVMWPYRHLAMLQWLRARMEVKNEPTP